MHSVCCATAGSSFCCAMTGTRPSGSLRFRARRGDGCCLRRGLMWMACKRSCLSMGPGHGSTPQPSSACWEPLGGLGDWHGSVGWCPRSFETRSIAWWHETATEYSAERTPACFPQQPKKLDSSTEKPWLPSKKPPDAVAFALTGHPGPQPDSRQAAKRCSMRLLVSSSALGRWYSSCLNSSACSSSSFCQAALSMLVTVRNCSALKFRPVQLSSS